MIHQVLAIGMILSLLAGSLWWLRRKGLVRYGSRSGQTQVLQSVERIALGPQHSLHLVRLAGRGLLVGISPAGCVLLESCEWGTLETRRPADVLEKHS